MSGRLHNLESPQRKTSLQVVGIVYKPLKESVKASGKLNLHSITAIITLYRKEVDGCLSNEILVGFYDDNIMA